MTCYHLETHYRDTQIVFQRVRCHQVKRGSLQVDTLAYHDLGLPTDQVSRVMRRQFRSAAEILDLEHEALLRQVRGQLLRELDGQLVAARGV